MDRPRDCVIRELRSIRKELLDLAKRNRLLNFKCRSGDIRIIDALPGQVFDHLVRQGKQMTFLPRSEEEKAADEESGEMHLFPETDDVSDGEPDEDLLPPDGTDDEAPEKHQNDKLQTTLEADLLETRLRRMRSEAQSAIQETGNNHLFLAMGFLRWKDRDDTAESYDAPLVLIPVEIVQYRFNRKAQRCMYRVRYSGEDLVANLSLREKLRKDHGLDLLMFSESNTTDVCSEDELDPEAYFNAVASAVMEMQGWEVRREMVVAFFTFAKLQMYLDLDPEAWPHSCIADNDLIQQLLGCMEHLPDGSAEADGEGAPQPDALPVVLDADSSQMRAIRRALSTRSMVIQGPPGTGKSQTITNLIACLLADGKSVLFVAEKMAALEVVYRNMEKAGLASMCLELHSSKADRKGVIRSLEASLERRKRLSRIDSPGLAGDLARLKKTRDSLAEYIELLRKPVGPADETVFDIFGKVELLRQKLTAIVPLHIENIDTITSDQIENAQEMIQHLSRSISEMGMASDSPWYGYEPVGLIAGDEDRVVDDLRATKAIAAKIQDEAGRLFEQVQASVCTPELTCSQMQAMHALGSHTIPENLLADIVESVLTDHHPSRWRDVESWKLRIQEYRTLSGNSLQFLKHDGDLPPADLTWLSQMAEQIRLLGLASLDLDAARALQENAERLGVLFDQLHELAGVPLSAGLPEPQRVGEIVGFVRLESLVRGKPKGIDGVVYEKLLGRSSRVLFTRMMEEGQRLTQMREGLARIFALNDVCPHDELTAARRGLRATQGWIRKVWSSQYRQAKRTLRGFVRQPALIRHPGMLGRLDALEAFLKEVAAFSCSREYREIFGESFKGLETNWDYATSMVAWVLNVDETCDSTIIGKAIAGLEFKGQDGWPAQGQIVKVVSQIEEQLSRYINAMSSLSGAECTTAIQNESIPMLRDRLARLASTLEAVERFVAPEVLAGKATLSDIVKAIEAQIEAQTLRAMIDGDEVFKALVGSHFKGVDTDIDVIADTITWALAVRGSGAPMGLICRLSEGAIHNTIAALHEHAHTWGEDLDAVKSHLDRLAEFGPLDTTKFLGNALEAVSLSALEARMDRAVSAIGYLSQWAGYCRLAKSAHQAGVGTVLTLMEDGRLDPAQAADTYLYTIYDTVARKVLREYPRLATFTTIEYESQRKAFAELDARLVQRHRESIGHQVSLREVPRGVVSPRVRELTDMQLLQRLFKGGRCPPIRQLMNRAGDAIKGLAPVFMMSPLSVAQFLEPGKHVFDVVIMDEASQIQPPEALGAIARTKHMVIVGDSKQLPPTNFFERTMNNLDDDQEETIFNDFDAGQSILTKCEQLQFPCEPLIWHYRSEHESLIAFSNARWYDSKLVLFPSSGLSSTELGIVHHLVEGATYTRGKRVNEIEGAFVARKIIEHARKSPELSLGVGTLNIAQRILIEDMLARLIKDDPSAELSVTRLNEAHGGTEPLFVKNLENLQGDQRDVIFISCTFGPDKDGRVYQTFGPLVRENGWRRLNVLITRAKKRVEVFTSMRSEDITGELGQEGRVAFKEYLKYAETGVLPDYGHPTGRPPDSEFERAVAQVVRNMGYEVQAQVGVAGYFVDIGVHNPVRPGEYILGIECDGAQYHSSVHARDRDRLREEVLRRRGWEIHRIWSTDWFKSREPETARLKRKLEELVHKSTPKVVEVAVSKELEPLVRHVARPRLTDDELRARIISHCRDNIPRSEKAQMIDGFLHPIVLNALVLYRVTDRTVFKECIPVEVRAAFSNDDLQHLDDVFEIIEQGS